MQALRYLMITLIFLVSCGENIQEQPSQNTQSSKKPEVFVQLGHSSPVSSVAFSPDGKFALSGSSDSTTRLWNIETGKEVAQMVAFNNGEWVTITP